MCDLFSWADSDIRLIVIINRFFERTVAGKQFSWQSIDSLRQLVPGSNPGLDTFLLRWKISIRAVYLPVKKIVLKLIKSK